MKRIAILFTLVVLLTSTVALAATPSFFGSAGSAFDNRPAEKAFRAEVAIENFLFSGSGEFSTPIPERVKYFGWAGGFDTSQYEIETLPMANIGTIGISDVRLNDSAWVAEMVKRNAKLIVSVHDVFYVRVRPATPEDPYPPFDLRSDYIATWQAAIAGKEATLAQLTAYFYVADEPNWNGISRSELAVACLDIKKAFPFVETLTSFNHLITSGWFEGQDVPTDAVAYHQYEVRDPRLSSLYQEKLTIVKQYSVGKPLLLVPDSWYAIGRHDVAGLTREDMGQVGLNYRATCAEEESCVGLVGFIWYTFAEGTGTRDLPQSVKFTYREIGSEITGKCLAPASVIAPETALWFEGCALYATLGFTKNGISSMGTAVSVERQFGGFRMGSTSIDYGLRIRPSASVGWIVFVGGYTILPTDMKVFSPVGQLVWSYKTTSGVPSTRGTFTSP
ncbi:MAG: hypothetical protein AAB495_02410 [Patescibacteria group bacterium]